MKKLSVYKVRYFADLKNGMRSEQTTANVVAESDAEAFEAVKGHVLLTDDAVSEIHAAGTEILATDVLVEDEDTRDSAFSDGYSYGFRDGQLEAKKDEPAVDDGDPATPTVSEPAVTAGS